MGKTVFLMEDFSLKASLVFGVKADPCSAELVEELLRTDS